MHTHPSETIRDAIRILHEYGVSQMPVVGPEPPVVIGEVVGSVSEGALLSAVFEGRAHLTDPVEIASEVGRLARDVGRDLTRDRRRAVRVVVKVRFAPFFTNTHGVRMAEPTGDPDAIARAAGRALAKFELDRPVRLLGVRAELEDPG